MDETDREKSRQATRILIGEAMAAWARAPAHVKAIAGAYVGPVVAALAAINLELEQLQEDES